MFHVNVSEMKLDRGILVSSLPNHNVDVLHVIQQYEAEAEAGAASSTSFPPLDVDRLGVPQPKLATKDTLIILFMFLLWGYSLYLTYRAWYKLLYSDGEEGTNMWRLADLLYTCLCRNTFPGSSWMWSRARKEHKLQIWKGKCYLKMT
jgi:hypothetical protein